MSRRRSNNMVKELNLNGISVSNFIELSNTVNKQFSTIKLDQDETINYNESSYIINFTVILTTSVSVKLVVMLF